MKKILRDYAPLALIAGAIIAADQISKYFVRTNLAFLETWMPWDWLAPYARIVYWYNTGAAFGMFQGGSNVFKVLAVLVALAIIYYYPRVPREEKLLRIALAMQLGGAVGNLIDRIAFGHVIDFVSVMRFPVFNVADASITLGVGVLILGVLIQDMHERRQRSSQPVDASSPPEPLLKDEQP